MPASSGHPPTALQAPRIAAQSTTASESIRDSLMIARRLMAAYGHRLHETFGGIFLDARHRILSEREIAVGTLKSVTVSFRDVFRFALSDHAAAVTRFHNHPSGDPSPSPQDLAFTARVVEIGQALGVEVLDHLIGTTSSFLSSMQRSIFEW